MPQVVTPRCTDQHAYTLGADNAEVEASIADNAGGDFMVTSITASFDDAAHALLILEDGDGGTTVWGMHIYDKEHIEFKTPIRITGEAVATLATGGANIAGAVSIQGYGPV